MKRPYELVFCLICSAFSVVLLVLSLLGAVRLAAINDEAVALETEVARLKTENEVRSAEYENMLSLGEIERYAVEVLGMQHCSAGQIVYIELPEG